MAIRSGILQNETYWHTHRVVPCEQSKSHKESNCACEVVQAGGDAVSCRLGRVCSTAVQRTRGRVQVFTENSLCRVFVLTKKISFMTMGSCSRRAAAKSSCCQLNTLHNATTYFFKELFNIILLTDVSSYWMTLRK
jgi:hypothetical protein